MFDKRKEFQMIDDKLNEIRILCNRLQIPFVWVAAVYDDGANTEYRVAVDENQEVDENAANSQYICKGLTPGSLGITLQDDKIRDIIKVLNGFKVVNSENPMSFDLGDFSVDAMAKANVGMYQQDEEGLFLEDEEEDTEEVAPKNNQPAPAADEQPTPEFTRTSSIIKPLVKEQNPNAVTMNIGKNMDLPYIASDFD